MSYTVVRSFYEGDTLHSEGETFAHDDEAYIKKCLTDGNIVLGEPKAKETELPVSFTTQEGSYGMRRWGENVSDPVGYFKDGQQITESEYREAYSKSIADAGNEPNGFPQHNQPAAPGAPAATAPLDGAGQVSTSSSQDQVSQTAPVDPTSQVATPPAGTSARSPSQAQIEQDMAFANGSQQPPAAPSLQ